jgi:hypothetical protein
MFRATPNVVARWATVAVFVLQCVAVVGTGNHFIFDGVIGLIVCAAGLAMAIWLQRWGYPAMRGRLALWAHTSQGAQASQRRREVSTE